MKRVKDQENVVHFFGIDDHTLCGDDVCVYYADRFGNESPGKYPQTSDPVTCPACAELYCRIKNALWNEVEEKTMDAAIYAAQGVKHDATSVSE